jgi:hypothetical protein
MPTAKQEVMELLKQLSDSSSLEEIQYHLYVHQKIHCLRTSVKLDQITPFSIEL